MSQYHCQSPPQTKLNILMIHGYTESGATFHEDNIKLDNALRDAFPAAPSPNHHPRYPGGVEVTYVTGPMRLKPTDWQRYYPGTDPGYAWFGKVPFDEEFPGLSEGLDHIGETLQNRSHHGSFDGVMGFSQGGFMASIMASLLEPGRKEVIDKVEKESGGMPYPRLFEGSHPLKFAVSFCGFVALNLKYQALYVPKIKTPVLQINGRIDDVVDGRRAQNLIDVTDGSEEEKVLIHPGGHTVPTSRLYLDAVIMFIKRCLEQE